MNAISDDNISEHATTILNALESVDSPSPATLEKLRELSRIELPTRLEVFRQGVQLHRFSSDDGELRGLLNSTMELDDDFRPFAKIVLDRMVATTDDSVFVSLTKTVEYLKPGIPQELMGPAATSAIQRFRAEKDCDRFWELGQALKVLASASSESEVRDLTLELSDRIRKERSFEKRHQLTRVFCILAESDPGVDSQSLIDHALDTLSEKLDSGGADDEWLLIETFSNAINKSVRRRGFDVLETAWNGDSDSRRKAVLGPMSIWSIKSHETLEAGADPADIRRVVKMFRDRLPVESDASFRVALSQSLCTLAKALPVGEANEIFGTILDAIPLEQDSEVRAKMLKSVCESSHWIPSDKINTFLNIALQQEPVTLDSYVVVPLLDALNPQHANELAETLVRMLGIVEDEETLSTLLFLASCVRDRLPADRCRVLTKAMSSRLEIPNLASSLDSIARVVAEFSSDPQSPDAMKCIEKLLQQAEASESPNLRPIVAFRGQHSPEHHARLMKIVIRQMNAPIDRLYTEDLCSMLNGCADHLTTEESRVVVTWVVSEFDTEREFRRYGDPTGPVLHRVLSHLDPADRKRVASAALRRLQSESFWGRARDIGFVLAGIADDSVNTELEVGAKAIVSQIVGGKLSDDDPWVLMQVTEALEKVCEKISQPLREEITIQLAQYITTSDRSSDWRGLAPGLARLAKQMPSEKLLVILGHLLTRISNSSDVEYIEELSDEYEKLAMLLGDEDLKELGARMLAFMEESDDEWRTHTLGQSLSQLSSGITPQQARKAINTLREKGGFRYVVPVARILMGQQGLMSDDERRQAFVDLILDPALMEGSYGDFNSIAATVNSSGLFWKRPVSEWLSPMEWKLHLVRWSRHPDQGGQHHLSLRRSTL